MIQNLYLRAAGVICLWALPVCGFVANADEPIDLLTTQAADGNLAGWSVFSEDETISPRDVWTLCDGVLICRGTPKGYLYTNKDYTNFVLRLQWRWPAGKEPGNGGVLIRTTEPHKVWPRSLEAQINTGNAGDFWGLDGYSLAGPAERTKTIDSSPFGRLINLAKTADVEKSPGEWNQYEIVAQEGTVRLIINGQVVNEATGCDVVPGRICLTAEGDEIHFRNVQLWVR